MNERKQDKWKALAEKHLSDSLYRDFILNDLYDKPFDISRRGIRMRLLTLFQSNPVFARMITGPSTFRLEELFHRHAVILFRLSRGEIGEMTSDIIGKFVVARTKAFGFRQANIPEEKRTHVHLFLDECQHFISPSINTILKEARKFGIHLTLAQQILGDEMSPDLVKAVLGNTAVKITGKNASFTLKKMEEETGAPLAELQALTTGQFHIKSGDFRSVAQRVPSRRIKAKGAISDEAWQAIRSAQLARFYREPNNIMEWLNRVEPTASALPGPLPLD